MTPSCWNSGPNSRSTLSWKPEKVSGVSIGTIMRRLRRQIAATRPAATAVPEQSRSGTRHRFLARPLLSGVRASEGRDLSKSLISSISSMGVMPQIASGEKTLSRSATAPISLPSI